MHCRVYPLAEEEHQGFLYLLRERMALDALETDLLLASQLRALSRVYRAVTHDLKAPLNAMVLNLDRLQVALRKGEGVEEAEKTQGYLDVLREELERLDRSLVALLAETTPAGSGREEFDVRATIQEIERLLLPQARLQHVALEAQLPGTAVRIAGQRDRLKQAILNVAINALEAMSDGGALEMIRRGASRGGRSADQRHRSRDPRGDAAPDLRHALHHQDHRHRHRPLPGALHRRGPWRRDQRREPARAAAASSSSGCRRSGRGLNALLHALVVEDDKNALSALAELVADEGFAVEQGHQRAHGARPLGRPDSGRGAARSDPARRHRLRSHPGPPGADRPRGDRRDHRSCQRRAPRSTRCATAPATT